MAIGVGDVAPDFSLVGTDGTDGGRRPYSLGEFRGKAVVLVFYPADNSPVCTRQLNSYTSDFGDFAELDAVLLALSPQTVESHEAFIAGQGGCAFPLLADSDKAVGAAYNVLGPLGFYRRSAFVVDGEGIIRYSHHAVAGITYRSTNELVDAVSNL